MQKKEKHDVCEKPAEFLSAVVDTKLKLILLERTWPLICHLILMLVPTWFKNVPLGLPLKIHIITHTGEKSHKCNMCEYAAYQASSLKTHMKKHVEEKPRIKTCKKPINDSLILNVDNNLKQKVAVPKYISGDLQKLGEQINSMVESSQNIIQHGKMQTTRAKICKVCRKEGDPSEIRRHIEAQHLNGVCLPCKDCEKTFRTRTSFWQHTRTWHTLRASKHPNGNSMIYH